MKARRPLLVAGTFAGAVSLLGALGGRPLQAADPHELKRLPKLEKGYQEDIAVAASFEESHPKPKPLSWSSSLVARIHREVLAVADDLPSQEKERRTDTHTLEGGDDPRYSSPGVGMDRGGQSGDSPDVTIERSGKVRRASASLFTEGELKSPGAPAWDDFLRRDPDGLARALQPTTKVADKGAWEVDPKTLLHLFVTEFAKLVTEGTHATATLDSFADKKDGPEAKIKLDALIVFRDPAAAKDAHSKLKLWATLHAATDGSRPPRKESVEYQLQLADGSRHTGKYELTRAPTK